MICFRDFERDKKEKREKNKKSRGGQGDMIKIAQNQWGWEEEGKRNIERERERRKSRKEEKILEGKAEKA